MTARELLEQAPIERYEAEVLLAHILGVDRSWLFSHGDERLASDDEQAFMAHARARASGEPLAYLMGYRDFWSLRLIVDQHVLIPRRETEHLVEWALECLDTGEQKVLDLGTGSGAIALACKSERSDLSITGVDQSEQALACARRNSEALGLEVCWKQGSWFEPVEAGGWDLVVSNPPYIAANDVHLGQGDLPAEPSGALVGGKTGLEMLEHIVTEAPPYLRASGWLLLEHGFDQGEPVRALLTDRGFSHVATREDYSGQPRISGGQWLN